MLIVNKKITKCINDFTNSFHNINYIGIQIRLGNADLNEKQFSDLKDLDIMLEIAKKQRQIKKWFVTGDSYKLKIELQKMQNKIVLFSKNKTKHYNYNRKDYSTIIEHEILSKSVFIIISKSTYGLTALLKSGLLLKNENLGYMIKKRNLYNVKLNFKNITSSWQN